MIKKAGSVTFLDRLPQDWSRPELRELRDLLVLAYPRRHSAEQITGEVRLAAGTFPFLDDMRSTWTELVRRLGDQGKLRALVERASADPTAEGYADRFKEILGGDEAVSATSPLGSVDEWWVGDDRSPVKAVELYEQRLLERRSRHFDIEMAASIVAMARSVGKLSVRFGATPINGTGFLIGPNLVLTSCHNIDNRKYGQATSAFIDFDHTQIRRREPLGRRLILPPECKDIQHDWAILKFERGVDRSPLRLGSPYDVGRDDAVIVIQHPLGAPKQFTIEPLAVRHADGNRIHYLADTQRGSSGSPVFNSRMHVIGIHQAETSAIVTTRDGTETVWRNQAVNIALVMRRMGSCGISFRSGG